MSRDWAQSFPQLFDMAMDEAERVELAALLDQGAEISVPADTTLFRAGDNCGNYILVLDGSVCVFTRAENGREIVLYRLGAGDSCVLTTSCLFAHADYPAEAVTESEVSGLQIPAALFHDALRESQHFREFVFASFGSHLGNLITLIEEVAFGKLDSRLARHLLQQAGPGDDLSITHQQLATELGSAREVISRLLKDLESNGWIRLQRGRIELLDRGALQAIAD